ncbi:MAG TPA: lipopolysaccharide assembly protein LapA domain-containing protein [Acidimicrobiia bacterium]|jgi:uncharacterized integral membrane protein|nr:lipopolysaccharide assembly protein LapA domain-containing protein [Acidimicrobiia bacterium]
MDEDAFRDIDEGFEEADDAPEPELETVGDVYREGFPWGLVVLLVFAVLLIVFSVQNAETTTVEFFGWDWVMPVALLVMITVLVTLVAVTIGLAFYRRRRRKRRLEKEAARSDR